MYTILAQLALVLSSVLPMVLLVIYFWNKRFKTTKNIVLLEYVSIIQFLSISFAFIALSYAYIKSDFSLFNVYKNSHLAVPAIYKFTGIWSNHEGSMLLWIFLLSLSGLVLNQQTLQKEEKEHILILHNLITASLIAYTLLRSNPFLKISPIPTQGLGFNPLLQDIGLAIHPPILYLGYVTTSIGFVISITALINKRLSKELLNLMQIANLFAWTFLGFGVALGSWWAYRELGWGGYWFWDPVENASLLPWLSSTALLHSIYNNKKLELSYRWTILLGLITFLLAILATLLVRSGAITSVHAFASDPSRGTFILVLLTIYSFFSLGLFATRAHYFQTKTDISFLSRYGGINIANILLVLSVAVILLALLYPIAIDLYQNQQITIERNFFEKIFIPILLAVLLVMSLTLPSAWQAILPIHYRYFLYAVILSLLSSVAFWYLSPLKPSFISLVSFFIGILVTIRMCFWYKQRLSNKISFKFYLIFTVHIAAGLLAAIFSIIETNSQELTIHMKQGDMAKFAYFEIKYLKNDNYAEKNYLVGRVILNVEKNGNEIATLEPAIRYYPVEKSQTSESAIFHDIKYDLYAVISELNKNGGVSIKLYLKPFMSWIWVISAVIFLCGIFLLLNMRYKNHAKTP